MDLKDLQSIHDLNYCLEGCWCDIELIDNDFIQHCQNSLKDYFEESLITFETFSENFKILEVLKKYEGMILSHEPLKNCKQDYSWVDFKTKIILKDKTKYLLEGEFCPADGYVFKTLKSL